MPIGRPIPNVSGHVLDGGLRLAPPGVPGELYLAGEALAHGYLNRPALTAERFVADPFGEPGSRMLSPGDLVRRLPDGDLEYLGRTDHQIKIRGVRIEPAEVRDAVAGCPGVTQAEVVVRDDPWEPLVWSPMWGRRAGERRLRRPSASMWGAAAQAPWCRPPWSCSTRSR